MTAEASLLGKVTIEGLQSRPELNGQEATAEEFHKVKGRYRVRLADESTIMVKPERIRKKGGYSGAPELIFDFRSNRADFRNDGDIFRSALRIEGLTPQEEKNLPNTNMSYCVRCE